MAIRRAAAMIASASAAGAAVLLAARRSGVAEGRAADGGLLMANPAAYDRLTRIVFGPLFRPIASDIARAVSRSGKVLEVGCGPGHLSILLAKDHGLDVTAVDLDEAMIERAEANAARQIPPGDRRPAFLVGDAAAMPFADGSFDIVVSTFSMHHWADPAAGLREIRRVLRPGGRALVWDLAPGSRLFHARRRGEAARVHESPFERTTVQPWRWPWRMTLSRRMELVRVEAEQPGWHPG